MQQQSVSDIAIDSAGNIILSGDYLGKLDFGGAVLDATDKSNGTMDAFVVKFDSTGNLLWSKRLGNATSQARPLRMALDKSNNVVVVGELVGAFNFGGGVLNASVSDIFVVKYDTTGNHLWSKRFGDERFDWFETLAIDGAGRITGLTHIYGAIEYGGGKLMNSGDPPNEYGVGLVQFDAAGNHLWSKIFGVLGVSTYSGTGLAVDALGNIIITEAMKGTVDFGSGAIVSPMDMFLAKFDANSQNLWSKGFKGTVGRDVASDATGRIFLAGNVYSVSADFGTGPLTNCLCSGSADVLFVRFEP